MKILIIGLGSIGKRHLANLSALGYTDISLVSRRGGKATRPVNKVFRSVEQGLRSEHFDTAFVCTPTASHVQDLLLLLDYQVPNIYVEKPLSHSMANVETVLARAADMNSNVVIGYDLHFDSGLQKVKGLIEGGKIGRIISANAFVGQHLTQWRPYEDHRQGTSARKETGGGVMLDLIHELDYLYWLFGSVDSVACHYINTGELEIETEEAAELLLKFSSGIIATVHLDYWQPQLKRYCTVTGTKGTVDWDLVGQTVTVFSSKGKEEFSYTEFTRNDRFMSIVRCFLEHPEDERLTRLPAAVESLKVVLSAKESAELNRLQKI